jgi:hypothetical protein
MTEKDELIKLAVAVNHSSYIGPQSIVATPLSYFSGPEDKRGSCMSLKPNTDSLYPPRFNF